MSIRIKGNDKVNLIIFIESAKSLINIKEICQTAVDLSKTSKFKPTSMVFGGDDFYASIGASKTADSIEVIYARQKMLLYAKAFNMQAIDVVHIQYKGAHLKLVAYTSSIGHFIWAEVILLLRVLLSNN